MDTNTEKALKETVRRVLNHPAGVVCKHWMIMTLLAELEKVGATYSLDFAKAVVNSDDEKALELLENETILPKETA